MSIASEDQRLLVDYAREVLREQASTERLRATIDTDTRHDGELWKYLCDLGWAALALPEDHGGLNSVLPDLAAVIQQCGRVLMPSALTSTSAVMWLLARHLDHEKPPVDLSPFASGERIATWSLHALDGGGALTAGEDREHLGLVSGTRAHLPNGGLATDALLDVRTEDGPRLVLLRLDQPGVSRRLEDTLDLTRDYAELELPAPGVSASHMLAPEATAELRRCGIVLQCAESIGVAARALAMTIEHVKQRSQFGRLIGSFQAVKHRLADMHVELRGAQVATLDAADAVQLGRSDADFAVHTAKSWTARAASMITSEAIQLHGGIGFTWEHDLHLLQRRAKANELLHGSPSWHDERLVELLLADRPATTGGAASTTAAHQTP